MRADTVKMIVKKLRPPCLLNTLIQIRKTIQVPGISMELHRSLSGVASELHKSTSTPYSGNFRRRIYGAIGRKRND